MKRRSGFTLVEVLMALGVLALMLGFTIMLCIIGYRVYKEKIEKPIRSLPVIRKNP